MTIGVLFSAKNGGTPTIEEETLENEKSANLGTEPTINGRIIVGKDKAGRISSALLVSTLMPAAAGIMLATTNSASTGTEAATIPEIDELRTIPDNITDGIIKLGTGISEDKVEIDKIQQVQQELATTVDEIEGVTAERISLLDVEDPPGENKDVESEDGSRRKRSITDEIGDDTSENVSELNIDGAEVQDKGPGKSDVILI